MNVSKRLVYPLSSSILRRSALSTSTIIKSGESGEGFFSSLFGIQKEIEHQSSSHSNQLSGHNDLLGEVFSKKKNIPSNHYFFRVLGGF